MHSAIRDFLEERQWVFFHRTRYIKRLERVSWKPVRACGFVRWNTKSKKAQGGSIGIFIARLGRKMQIIGSLILGMIITILAVTLMILYVVVLVIGIGWLGQKIENLKNLWTQKEPASSRSRSLR